MSVNSIQLLFFTCAVELTLLAFLAQGIFRPAAMLLMAVASLSFIAGLAWEMIPIIAWLSWFADSPKFWCAAVGLIWITTLTLRTSSFVADAKTAPPESQSPTSQV